MLRNAFKAYAPGQQLMQLKVGDISFDRSVIMGKKSVLFIYSGSNNYYDQYLSSHNSKKGFEWADLTAARHLRLGLNAKIISLFVPNKASCMPDLYPLPLDNAPTKIWQNLKTCLFTGSNFLFSDKLFNVSNSLNRESNNPWRLVDSHWSEFGCLATVNETLGRLGLKEISCEVEITEPFVTFGDLSSKFSSNAVSELKNIRLRDRLSQPTRSFDSGGGAPYEGSVGRRVTWSNPGAEVPLHLLIVGNSFAGSGDSTEHLTYWFSRVFKNTTFLHSGHMPDDVLDFYRPDIILFQTCERFLISLPTDDISSEQIEGFFNAKISQ
jgi:hypothetical protein